eukprot:Nk52_evm33s292 gene=Nk52_evmTU33s292
MGKKSFNPVEEHRKEQKKREIKKQKVLRKQAKEATLRVQDPKQLFRNICSLEDERTNLAEHIFNERRRKIEENLQKVVAFWEKEDPEKLKEYNTWEREEKERRKRRQLEIKESAPPSPPPFKFKHDLPPGIARIQDIPLPEGNPPLGNSQGDGHVIPPFGGKGPTFLPPALPPPALPPPSLMGRDLPVAMPPPPFMPPVVGMMRPPPISAAGGSRGGNWGWRGRGTSGPRGGRGGSRGPSQSGNHTRTRSNTAMTASSSSTVIKPTVSVAPQLRDTKKELTQFVPLAVNKSKHSSFSAAKKNSSSASEGCSTRKAENTEEAYQSFMQELEDLM